MRGFPRSAQAKLYCSDWSGCSSAILCFGCRGGFHDMDESQKQNNIDDLCTRRGLLRCLSQMGISAAPAPIKGAGLETNVDHAPSQAAQPTKRAVVAAGHAAPHRMGLGLA